MMKNIFTSKQRLVRLAYATGLLSLVLAVALSLSAGGTLAANMFATAPGLGVAESFAVLGGSTVTNTGSSVINGNLGVSPGSAVTGFPPGIVNPPGVIHAADAVALNAQTDVTTAYDILESGELNPCDQDLTGQDLSGLTLTPGVYCFDSSAQLTGTLKLDGQGDEWAVFIFKMGSTLTTASSSSVEIINADQLCNVFWQVGSSATLGTGTAFKGNILALESITLNTGATIIGRALARTAAVTLDTNTITIPYCDVQAATQTAQAATQTVQAATQTAQAATQTVQAATQTAIAATQTQAATQTATKKAPTQAPTHTESAQDTEEVKPTSTAKPETLPDTGGDLAGPGSQIIRNSLGALGITLILFGFMLRRRAYK